MNDLAYYLRLSYGLAPHEPTDAQVGAISDDVRNFARINNREPSREEMGAIVRRHCRTFQTHKYAADVNLELRRQIALLATQAKK